MMTPSKYTAKQLREASHRRNLAFVAFSEVESQERKVIGLLRAEGFTFRAIAELLDRPFQHVYRRRPQ